MKIWITRPSAFSLQCGGLDRLEVWFANPVWIEPKFWMEEDMMLGTYRGDGCRCPNGWGVFGGRIQSPISFGASFGYEGELPELVWSELCKHFGNVDMRKWDEYELENEQCDMNNFKLHYDLGISIKTD